MKKTLLIILISFLSCEQNQYEEKCDTTTKEVVDKKEKLETSYQYTENFFGSGDSVFKKVPNTSTVYYVIFSDKTLKKVSLEQYIQYEVGLK